MSPLAGSATACVIFNSKSTLGMLQLSAQLRDGRSLRPAISLRPTPPARRSLPASAMDHSKTVLHANQRTTAAWIFPAFRMASARCLLRGGNFGSAARGSATHRDKRSVVSFWERPARAIRSATTEAMTARHQQGMHEVLGGCESACRYHARPRLRWPALASLLFHGLHRSSGVKGRLKTDSQESS